MGLALRLAGQEKDLGNGFRVRRLLPAASRQSVGPFLFFDHFGPVTVQPGTRHDVRPHPHIGLATVTYLFEGAIMHRDSAGFSQRIEPGAINWMTAGRGIVHSERAPQDLHDQTYVNHGLQLWAALPLEAEEVEPDFSHTPAAAIPQFGVGSAQVRLLIGEAFGRTSPVKTFSPTVYLDIALPAHGLLELPPLAQELAVYPVDGDVRVDGELLAAHTLGVLMPGVNTQIRARSPVRLAVVGGAAVDAHRFIWWNFVSSRRERIREASQAWAAQAMGQVAGETEFIELPERSLD